MIVIQICGSCTLTSVLIMTCWWVSFRNFFLLEGISSEISIGIPSEIPPWFFLRFLEHFLLWFLQIFISWFSKEFLLELPKLLLLWFLQKSFCIKEILYSGNLTGILPLSPSGIPPGTPARLPSKTPSRVPFIVISGISTWFFPETSAEVSSTIPPWTSLRISTFHKFLHKLFWDSFKKPLRCFFRIPPEVPSAILHNNSIRASCTNSYRDSSRNWCLWYYRGNSRRCSQFITNLLPEILIKFPHEFHSSKNILSNSSRSFF